MNKIYFACVREKKSKDAYVVNEFTSCETKKEVRELCKENGYVVSGNVYTKEQWENNK
jgi:hypothetical protein